MKQRPTRQIGVAVYLCLQGILLLCVSPLSVAGDYYPLHLGSIWLYEAKESGQPTYTQVSAVRSLPANTQREPKGGILQVISNFATEQIIEENHFTQTDDALNLHHAIVHEGKVLIVVNYQTPVKFLVFPLNVGQDWRGTSSVTILLQGEFATYGAATVHILGEYAYQSTVMAEESVTDAVGNQEYSCRKVNTEGTLTIKQIHVDAKERLNASFIRQALPWRVDDQVKTESTRWLASDVGEVKFEETTVYPDGNSAKTELTLKGLKLKEN